MKKINLLPYVACFGLGFFTCWIWPENETEYSISHNKISYYGKFERPLHFQNDKIIVGTLEQRIDDLLDEPPGEVKRLAEKLINQELKYGNN